MWLRSIRDGKIINLGDFILNLFFIPTIPFVQIFHFFTITFFSILYSWTSYGFSAPTLQFPHIGLNFRLCFFIPWSQTYLQLQHTYKHMLGIFIYVKYAMKYYLIPKGVYYIRSLRSRYEYFRIEKLYICMYVYPSKHT